MITDKDRARFERFVGETTATGCVHWNGGLVNGYGAFKLFGKDLRAHRAAWLMAGRSLTPGLHLLHSCDNRRCINVDHLHEGTNLQNMREKVERGRQPRGQKHARGEGCGQAKLNWAAVKLIRETESVASQQLLADAFGVSQSTISLVRSRRRWGKRPEDP